MENFQFMFTNRSLSSTSSTSTRRVESQEQFPFALSGLELEEEQQQQQSGAHCVSNYLNSAMNHENIQGGGDMDEEADPKPGATASNSRSTGEAEAEAEAEAGGRSKKKERKQRYAFQTRSQVDILDDGYRWRKYGQKAVKNNKFPRSYYRCTYQGCSVKKQVQRLTKDEGVVVTTYEGVHSHPIHNSTDNFEHILTQMHIYAAF